MIWLLGGEAKVAGSYGPISATSPRERCRSQQAAGRITNTEGMDRAYRHTDL